MPQAQKVKARSSVREAVPLATRAGAEVFVRVNKPYLWADLEAAVWPDLSGIMLPKVESGAEVSEVARLLERLERQRGLEVGSLQLIVLLESALGVWNIRDIITASPRVTPNPDDLTTRIITGAVLAAVAILAFVIGRAGTAVLVTVIVAAAAFELFEGFRRAGFQPATLLALLGSLSMVGIAYNHGERAFPLVSAVVIAFTLFWYLAKVVHARPMVNAAVTIFGFAYVGLLGGFALLYRPDLVVAVGLGFAVLWRVLDRRQRKRLCGGLGLGLSPYLVHIAMAGPGHAFYGMVIQPVFQLRSGRHLPLPPSWSHFDGFLQKAGVLNEPPWPFPSPRPRAAAWCAARRSPAPRARFPPARAPGRP